LCRISMAAIKTLRLRHMNYCTIGKSVQMRHIDSAREFCGTPHKLRGSGHHRHSLLNPRCLAHRCVNRLTAQAGRMEMHDASACMVVYDTSAGINKCFEKRKFWRRSAPHLFERTHPINTCKFESVFGSGERRKEIQYVNNT
jgi:hypothetical protein